VYIIKYANYLALNRIFFNLYKIRCIKQDVINLNDFYIILYNYWYKISDCEKRKNIDLISIKVNILSYLSKLLKILIYNMSVSLIIERS